MKSIKTLALVTGLLAISGVSQAQFSSTWTVVSDYDYRGVSQSAKDPALQGSADYAFGDSGFAIGAWASNVDWGVDEDVEVDVYASYAKEINDTFGEAFVALGEYEGEHYGLPTNINLKSMVWYPVDDFEAAMTWVIGLDGQRAFTVQVLQEPLRVVVDIAK